MNDERFNWYHSELLHWTVSFWLYQILYYWQNKQIWWKNVISYFSQEILEYCMWKGRKGVVVSADKCVSNFKDLLHLCTCHQKASTKSILYPRDTTMFNAFQINIHSPASNALFIALQYYPLLSRNTLFFKGKSIVCTSTSHVWIPWKRNMQCITRSLCTIWSQLYRFIFHLVKYIWKRKFEDTVCIFQITL